MSTTLADRGVNTSIAGLWGSLSSSWMTTATKRTAPPPGINIFMTFTMMALVFVPAGLPRRAAAVGAMAVFLSRLPGWTQGSFQADFTFASGAALLIIQAIDFALLTTPSEAHAR